MGRETDSAAKQALAIEIKVLNLEISNLTYKIEDLKGKNECKFR